MYWRHDPNEPVTKVCTKCGVEKPFPEFYLRYSTGRRLSWCRVCDRARVRRYCRANRAKRRAARRRCAPEQVAARRAARRRWYAQHVEERRAAGRRYYAENRERVLATAQASRRRNAERLRERRRRYRERNPRKVAARMVTWGLRVLGLLELAKHCADCGGKATEHHHLSYEDPFAVVSLCRRCHMRRHFAV